jgi:hypothetical protein
LSASSRIAAARAVAVVLVYAWSLIAACADGPMGIEEGAEFQAVLTGSAERPDPVETDASGTVFFDHDGDGVRFLVEVEDIENATFAFLYVGEIDVAGSIVVELFDSGESPVTFGGRGTLAEGTFTAADIHEVEEVESLNDLLEAMRQGDTYVSVHTIANPLGEIRGQIAFDFPPD